MCMHLKNVKFMSLISELEQTQEHGLITHRILFLVVMMLLVFDFKL